MTRLLDAIAQYAKADRANPAFDDGSTVIDWVRAKNLIESAAAQLEQAASHSRPIGLLLDHGIASAILLIACLEARVPIIPLPPYFTDVQRDAALIQAGTAGVIRSCALEEERLTFAIDERHSARVELPQGTAVISFSSGSTGAPKGVCLSADHLIAIAKAVCTTIGAELAGRHLPVLPFGILLEQVAGLFGSMIAGGTYLARPIASVGLANPVRPDALALLSAIENSQATSLILVPEYLGVLVGAIEASGRRLNRLNLVAVGGARTPNALLERAAAVGLPVRQGYGMTEAGSVVAIANTEESLRGTVGRSIGAHEIWTADDGEIVISGPMHLGLIGAPRADGPFATGDIGRVDDNGCLSIEGRKSNIIVTSLGRNIAPEWIEGLLVSQPEIAQAMVRGSDDDALQALIVPSSPTARVDEAVGRVSSQLPEYARFRVQLVPPLTPANGLLTGNGRLRREAINAAYPRSVADRPFYQRLMFETREAQARFAMTPQLIAGLTGAITRGDYIAYLTQAYHHVRHTVPLMQAARQRLLANGNQLLVAALDEYIDEETGHEEWILDDIKAAGGSRTAAAESKPAEATRAMVDHVYSTIRTGNPASFFGMVYVLEGTSVAMASNGAAAVQQRLALPKSAFRYLTSHGAVDQDHLVFFENLMNRIGDVADQEAIVAMANDIFRLFGGMFAGIELEGMSHAA